jgi:CBS domain containing-hemolysin-like protein
VEYDYVAWLIFAAAALLVGLVAAVEVALTAVDRSQIRKRSEDRDSRAALVEGLLQDSAQFWLTSMLVKTIGLLSAGVAVGRVFTASAGIVTVVFATILAWLALGAVQIIGRSLAVGNAEKVALRLAPLARTLVLFLSPFTFMLYRAGERLTGDDSEERDDSVFLSEDGLRRLMQVDEEGSAIADSEKEMIAGILDMNTTVAREVMVPRIDMVSLPVECTMHEALDEIMAHGHSRIPVYEEHVDVIVGLLYAKDLLRCFRENRTDVPIRELLRPAYFVPATKKVNQLLRELQVQRIHLAMVVDEYGGIAGLVTIEDIIEEIFGEIQDEYDVNEAILFQPFGENSYILNARLDMDTLGKLLDLDLDEEDADTLGGLIYSRLGHVPIQGETIQLEDWRLRVLSLEGRRINQVRADRVPPPVEEPSEQVTPTRLRSRKPGFDAAKLDPSRLDASNLSNSSLTNHT